MTEKVLQNAIIDAARLLGWRVAHFRPARVTRNGKEIYETPVAADGKGFPDLVMVKDERLIFAELKSRNGRTSPNQDEWLRTLNGSAQGFAEVYVWRPADWESGVIIRRLKGG